MVLDGGGIAAGPAGDDELLDVEGERVLAGYLELQCRHSCYLLRGRKVGHIVRMMFFRNSSMCSRMAFGTAQRK
ncbi:hypothetical protein BKK79_00715 [Cupriavidus sp. USMAA2-4]|uniref:hypothetical protein n=1 Tax=Cupriavidus sp. USMAA2-4 TaxID=876364 RepID=UPI0008A71031|nr:hypothetical protein [Cupriavidus sp. USMAA2-4]AOY90512.1 hypothetical protein BKK79_00715 [Cupriavidus sp. USMAA2-4]